MTSDQSVNTLKLEERSDIKQLASKLATAGRLQIANLLTNDSASAILRCLTELPTWNLVFNNAGEHVDMNLLEVAGWTRDQRDSLSVLVNRQARKGFQYHYAAVPIYDAYHTGRIPDHFLNTVFEFLNSSDFLNLMRVVANDASINFADAQATCYMPGHFLTRHDDNVAGKHRRLAYVLNLTPEWNADWGGALQFHDESGNVECGFTPAYNVLNLFRIPASHSVGIVAPFAGGNRYSITGWLRSGDDPMARSPAG